MAKSPRAIAWLLHDQENSKSQPTVQPNDPNCTTIGMPQTRKKREKHTRLRLVQ